jgi:hypothetical protein
MDDGGEADYPWLKARFRPDMDRHLYALTIRDAEDRLRAAAGEWADALVMAAGWLGQVVAPPPGTGHWPSGIILLWRQGRTAYLLNWFAAEAARQRLKEVPYGRGFGAYVRGGPLGPIRVEVRRRPEEAGGGVALQGFLDARAVRRCPPDFAWPWAEFEAAAAERAALAPRSSFAAWEAKLALRREGGGDG